jgi:hypothetical protein
MYDAAKNAVYVVGSDGTTAVNFYATGEVSAYGAGTGGGSVSYNRLDAWGDYDSSKSGWVLSALLGNDLNTRVTSLESGSALNITTTGTGNAITAITKSGNTITATKGSAFSVDGHTHTKSQITDFPTSMPASDVYAWAKAATKPTYTYTEVGAAAASHTHDYLPLAGGTLTDNLSIRTGNNDKFITFDYLGNDTYNWRIGYLGTGSGEANYLVFQSSKKSGGIYYNALRFGLVSLKGDFAVTPSVNGVDLSLSSHTHPAVTTSIAGFMSAADKTKLDGISAGARPGTVTSVGLSVPTGLSVTGSPITTSGTLAIALASGYAIPTTAKQNNWDTAYTHSQSAHAYLPLSGGTMTGAIKGTHFYIGYNWTAKTNGIQFGIDGLNSGLSFYDGVQPYSASIFREKENFYVGVRSGNRATGITIDRLGNIGIGTTSPAYTLDVSGTGRFTGNLTAPTFIGNLNGNASTASSVGGLTGIGTATPLMDGTASVGTSTLAARQDHRHPTDTSRAAVGQTMYIGTTAVAINRASGTLNLAGIGSLAMGGALTGVTTLTASTSVTVPKVIFAVGGWSVEQTGTEIQFKYNNVVKQRLLSDGSIVAVGEVTAFGATS